MFIRTDFFHLFGLKEKNKLLGLKDGQVIAADFLAKLPIYAIESDEDKDKENLTAGSRLFSAPFAYSQTILAKFNLDMELFLNQTVLTFEDLQRILISYILSSREDVECSPFGAILLPFSKREESSQEFDTLDFEIAIQDGLKAVVDGIISVCLVKQLGQSTERLNDMFLDKHRMVENHKQDKTTMEIKEQNQQLTVEVDQMKKQFEIYKQNYETLLLNFNNKETLYKEKIEKLQNENEDLKKRLIALEEKHKEDKKIVDTIPFNELKVEVLLEDNYIEKIKSLNIAVIGGHSNFHTQIREEIGDNVLLISPRDYNSPLHQLESKDVIVVVTTYNNHSQTKRVRKYLSKRGMKSKIFMVNSQSEPKAFAKKVYEFYQKRVEE